MSSFGESDLIIDSTQVGRVRVLSAHAGSPHFPRLQLRLGLHLLRLPARFDASVALDEYELRTMDGELRLHESGEPVALIHQLGDRRPVRYAAESFEHQWEFACDLTPVTLERIERRRDGGTPCLWLALWPTVLSASRVLNAQIRPIQLLIPRDVWIEFLTRASTLEYDILEISYPSSDSEHVARAIAHLREARTRIVNGEYRDAVACCRKVVEAAYAEVKEESSDGSWKSFFAIATPDKRADEYAQISAKLKQLGAIAHHDFGSAVAFAREDAEFAVRCTHAFLVLVGQLRARQFRDTVG